MKYSKKAKAQMLLDIISNMDERDIPANADGSLNIEMFQQHPVIKAVVTLLKYEEIDVTMFPVAQLLLVGMWKEHEMGDCVLCEKRFFNFGHNPAPLSEEGRCCDSCNNTKVIPARIKSIR